MVPLCRRLALFIPLLLLMAWSPSGTALPRQARYYAHDAVEDRHGVIAPWYQGQNGQCDWRVRIAAETLKRYPWTGPGEAVAPAPHYVYSGAWQIAPDGTITIPALSDWANGDLGQRAAYVLSGLVDYYRYSGDPAAVAHVSVLAEVLLDYCQTPPDHPWPEFLISVPTRGRPYGRCDPQGMIQLDIVAEVGLALLRAYQLTGTERWFRAAAHWGDLLAQKRSRETGDPPWNRYANPEDIWWEDQMTGGVAFLLFFFDELIRLGYTGPGDQIVAARDAGRAYLRDRLLPRWTVDDVWGRNYWDWPDPVQAENVTEFVARYLMENPDQFPKWRVDARNILSLFLNRTSVSPASRGDVYSGAWAYPESSGCCGRSLWYGPLELAPVYAQYGVLADSDWGREMGRRQVILATYDAHETGVVEDNIDGGPIVAGDWFKIAHPMALKHVLAALAWLPDILGAARENHIMRSSAVVSSVVYGDGRIEYSTFDAPANTVEALRLAFRPRAVSADGHPLPRRSDLGANGFRAHRLPNGDWLLQVRHDGSRHIVVGGDDPQETADDEELGFEGEWTHRSNSEAWGGGVRVASTESAAATFSFRGNQVRVLGPVGPTGGRADLYLDGELQPVGIDQWSPAARHRQVVYYRNGLADGDHILRVVARGEGNPLSQGAEVVIDALQWSAATGMDGYGEGGGPVGAQRVIFGYPGRADYVDSDGSAWRPATEWIARSGHLSDAVQTSWWKEPRRRHIAGASDPELYRYGAHAPELTAYFTVGPGLYHVRLKFAETRNLEPRLRAVTVHLNDEMVVDQMDIAATAGGLNRAVDLVLNGVRPQHGVIALRFSGNPGGEAIVQAVEIGPGDGGTGAQPICLPNPAAKQGDNGNLLVNPGFEDGATGDLGALGKRGGGFGWQYLFAGAGQSYIWTESAYSIHPDWGLPEVRSGREAIRTHTDGEGHTLIYQEAAVRPDTLYAASVWVRAVDLHGLGFGTYPGDSAGLRIQELDANGNVVKDHPGRTIRDAGPYQQLSLSFRTAGNTARVRFILDTVIHGPYDEGHVTYDDCALMREED